MRLWKDKHHRKPCAKLWEILAIEYFTISPHYKNGNIANFILAVPLKINKNNKVYNLEMWRFVPTDS